MRVIAAFFLIGAIACAGCASVPAPPTLPAGDRPTNTELLSVIRGQLKRDLKDYDSMKDFSLLEGPVEAYAIYGVGGIENLWFACAEFNAKNSYGGYTGLQRHPFYVRRIEGKVVHIAPIGWRSVNKTC